MNSASSTNDLFISGGYDRTIKLWDKRVECSVGGVFSCLASKASVLTISTPHPVSCLYQVSPSVLLAGSDKDIFVYDLLLNGK